MVVLWECACQVLAALYRARAGAASSGAISGLRTRRSSVLLLYPFVLSLSKHARDFAAWRVTLPGWRWRACFDRLSTSGFWGSGPGQRRCIPNDNDNDNGVGR